MSSDNVVYVQRCQGLCIPFIIYVIIAAILIIYSWKYNGIIGNLFNILFSILIAYILYSLCQGCKQGAAWILLIIILAIWIAFYAFGKYYLNDGGIVNNTI